MYFFNILSLRKSLWNIKYLLKKNIKKIYIAEVNIFLKYIKQSSVKGIMENFVAGDS